MGTQGVSINQGVPLYWVFRSQIVMVAYMYTYASISTGIVGFTRALV